MIAADQPVCFPDDLVVAVSSRTDGTMLDRSLPLDDESVVTNRRSFCEVNDLSYEAMVYQQVVYANDASYELIAEVDQRSTTSYTGGIVADALFTDTPGVGLFLPVADCVPVVIYDPIRRYLSLLHMGRHSTMSQLLPKVVRRFISLGSRSESLIVWMGPSAARASYKLERFVARDEPAWQPFLDVRGDGIYLDMSGYNRQQCLDMGIMDANIHISFVDTMADENYFSHANGDIHSRMAAIALMR